MRRRFPNLLALSLATILAAAFSAVAVAEIARLSPEELKEDADAIVVGKAAEVRAKTDRDAGWERTHGVVIVQVEKSEKGDKLNAGDKVEIAFWTQRWVGRSSPPPYGSGHDVPEVGAIVRAHLKVQKDGTYEALLPNGLVPLPSATKTPAK